MLIDSGATVTAISADTAREASVETGTGLSPVILKTANGMAPAQTGAIDELRVGNIVARNLKIVSAPGLGDIDVIGMNFLSELQSWRVEGRTLVLVPHQPQRHRRRGVARQPGIRLSASASTAGSTAYMCRYCKICLAISRSFAWKVSASGSWINGSLNGATAPV